MKRIDVKDLPSNVSAYELDDGRIFRVHLELKTPVDQLATAGDVEVETRGYQINAQGALLVNDSQEPIMLAPQRARIPLTNVRSGLDTVKPAWVKQVFADDASREKLTEGVKKLKHLPKTGEPGDSVMVGDDMFVFSDGLYESVRRSRAAEIKVDVVNDELTEQVIADLTP